MRITTARRISQVLFLALFAWFAVVATLGDTWWRLRGWPINWLLQLDPLVGLATLIATGTLYAGLLWAAATLGLTILLGRFFCGWVCPFGTIHQAVGYLGHRGKPVAAQIQANRYRRGQSTKYYILLVLLGMAGGDLLAALLRWPAHRPWVALGVAMGAVVVVALLVARRAFRRPGRALAGMAAVAAAWAGLGLALRSQGLLAGVLYTGLLDPIPLLYRCVNLAILPAADAATQVISPSQRFFAGAWLIALAALAAVGANLAIPRFYCRFVCPLGALLGLAGRGSLGRIGKTQAECLHCRLCQRHCEGACEPAQQIRWAECVLCGNCLHDCRHGLMGYRASKSAAGEVTSPDIGRRGVLLSLAGGLAAVPLIRLGGRTGPNWNPSLIRPPGSLDEGRFLARCIRCGQCMRVCPTNVIQPAGLEMGLEALWTPALNNRIGTSGCQLNCVACGNVCPTAAIRPLTLDERHGAGSFAGKGPIRIGTAFVDQGRCLPWAMARPCIVCQENCPVSPKAIYVQEAYETLRDGRITVTGSTLDRVEFAPASFADGRLGSGDYYLAPGMSGRRDRRLIGSNTAGAIQLAQPLDRALAPGSTALVQVRLQRPVVDISACIGCGVCEHECPVSGQRAIRVTAENESRGRERALLV